MIVTSDNRWHSHPTMNVCEYKILQCFTEKKRKGFGCLLGFLFFFSLCFCLWLLSFFSARRNGFNYRLLSRFCCFTVQNWHRVFRELDFRLCWGLFGNMWFSICRGLHLSWREYSRKLSHGMLNSVKLISRSFKSHAQAGSFAL